MRGAEEQATQRGEEAGKQGWGRQSEGGGRQAGERAVEGAGGGRRGFSSSLLALSPGLRRRETCGRRECAGGERCAPLGPAAGGARCPAALSRLSLCPPQRHGLAVCLALTTMCTSLLLMYGGIGGGGGHPEPRRRQQQQQVAAVPSRPAGHGQHHPALPVGAGLLEGYISVLEHKVSLLRSRGRASRPSLGAAAGPALPRPPKGTPDPVPAKLSFLPSVRGPVPLGGIAVPWLPRCRGWLLQPSGAVAPGPGCMD